MFIKKGQLAICYTVLNTKLIQRKEFCIKHSFLAVRMFELMFVLFT